LAWFVRDDSIALTENRLLPICWNAKPGVCWLEAALAQVKTWEGILPICAACKKIRDEANAWVALDEYVNEHSEARFSHGMCPDCVARFTRTMLVR
jgi:hypothetical protein